MSHKSARKAEKLGYTNVKVFAAGYPAWIKTPGNYASVSADYVAKKIESNEITLIDARPYKPKFVKGHIPTAINIPDSKFDEMVDQLPQDKTTPLVFYCGGHTCKLSHKSAKKAIALGYSNVKVFSAGYPGWKKYAGETKNTATISIKRGQEEGSIDIATFEKIITEKPDSIVLIDSRDADEFKIGSIKTAVNIPVDRLEQELKTIVADKPIIFICSTGARSGESYYMVQDLRPSLKEVYYLDAKVMFNDDGSYEITATES